MSMDDNTRYEDFLDQIREVNGRHKREDQFIEGIAESGAQGESALGPLGDRVRTIREQKKLTLADVASRTGFDESFLQKIEDNKISPPLGDLIKLGKALDMKMGFFISGGETQAYTVVRRDDRRKIARRAASQDEAYGYTYQSLAPGKTDRHMEPFLITLEPSEDEELSTHEGQEFIFVMEGSMEAVIGDDRLVLTAGDSIYYDSNVPHMVRCVDGPATKILAVLYAYDK
jgi:transcriptional regulator with XRE-family HTH domain